MPIGVDKLARVIACKQHAAGRRGGRHAVGNHATLKRAAEAHDALARNGRGAVNDGALDLVTERTKRLAVRSLFKLAGKGDVLDDTCCADAREERLDAASVVEGNGVALAVECAVELT